MQSVSYLSDSVSYLSSIETVPSRLPPVRPYPFNLPFVEKLNLTFSRPVTIFVGENGAGKSSLIEAIAVLCGLPVWGGGRNELADGASMPEQGNALSIVLRPSFRKKPRDGYFFRAESQSNFASMLDMRKADPDFQGDPYARYGGRSLHAQSHGEAFLSILQNRLHEGIFILDEPESALSPERQLFLLAIIHNLVRGDRAQFICATHSPILMTYPGAELINFDNDALPRTTLEETSHYKITKRMLEDPASYWKHVE